MLKTITSKLLLFLLLLTVSVLAFAYNPQPVVAQGAATAALPDPQSAITYQTRQGTITELVSQTEQAYPDGTNTLQQIFKIQLDSSKEIEVMIERLSKDDKFAYKVGDSVVVNEEVINDQSSYYIADHVRTPGLALVFGMFVLVILVVSGWHGVRSLIGLGSSFVVIFYFILPFLEQGYNPIFVAIVGALFIMLVTFYLSHGFNYKTHLAVAGTFLSLIATGILSLIFISITKLTGFATEEAVFLQITKGDGFNAQGMLLAGIIIGTLGVLDDITLSQASIVQELIQANPKLNPRKLFIKAMNVGKDHIASLVNTLVLVYTGASLPLLLLFKDSQISTLELLNYEMIAEEIVRTLVGSAGLVLAVPLTTLLAVLIKDKLLHAKCDEHGHKH